MNQGQKKPHGTRGEWRVFARRHWMLLLSALVLSMIPILHGAACPGLDKSDASILALFVIPVCAAIVAALEFGSSLVSPAT